VVVCLAYGRIAIQHFVLAVLMGLIAMIVWNLMLVPNTCYDCCAVKSVNYDFGLCGACLLEWTDWSEVI
jgi:hypothetical protein